MKILKRDDIWDRNGEFEILTKTKLSQVASMVLESGAVSGEYGSEHPNSDQILIVLSGEAQAKVSGEILTLSSGDVLVISAGEDHQIQQVGKEALRTINIYAPPAY